MEAKKAWREAEAKEAWRMAEVEEAWRMAEVEEAQRKVEEEERAQKEAEKQKKAKALVAWHKQLELLLQRKVTARIAWEEEIWRASEAGGEPLHSSISGYGKGKVPEKRICTNCLRKGIECEWDENFFFFTCTQLQ